MRCSGRIVGLVLLLCLGAAISFGQASGSEPIEVEIGLAGFDLFRLELYAGLKGFELVPGAPSRALLYFGGGRIGDTYYRDAEDQLLPVPLEDGTVAKFNKWNAALRLGLDIGLVYDDQLRRNSLYGQIFVKSFFDSYIENDGIPAAIGQANLADRAGAWESALFGGLVWDTVVFNPKLQSKSGAAARLSAEWAPGLAFNQLFGNAAYVRLNGGASVFLPLVETESYGLYLADLLTLDALFGDPASIPGFARRTAGGFDRRPAPGGLVRGIEAGRYDTYLKFINNTDLRLNFMPLFAPASSPEDSVVVPELFLFFDAGLVDNLDWKPGRWLASTGGGVILNLRLFGVKMDFGYYVSWSIPENRWNFFNLVLGAHHF